MLEIEILKLINAFVGLSIPFDNAVYYLANFTKIKMLPMIVILFYLWVINDKACDIKNLNIIVQGIIGSFTAMFVARILAKTLPFRLRPLHHPNLSLNIPEIMPDQMLDHWSSMPSDHATLGFALATVIFYVNKKWGFFAYLHVLILICLPRVYLSLHYPSDILVGFIVGVGIIYIVLRLDFIKQWSNKILFIKSGFPNTFYFFAILVAFQIATMFQTIRGLIITKLTF